MRKCAIIPALNEEKHISEVVEKVKRNNIDPIVINDGSIDNTYNLALSSGAQVISHKTKQGKGSAIRDGLNFALERNYDLIFTLDGDGQHNPEEIGVFLNALEDNSIVVGNRMHNPKNMPLWRNISNRVNSLVVSFVCGQKVPDAQCGYRLFTSESIKAIDIEANNYEIELEMIIKLSRKGFKIISVPVDSIYGLERSDIRPVKDSLKVFVFLVRMLIRA